MNVNVNVHSLDRPDSSAVFMSSGSRSGPFHRAQTAPDMKYVREVSILSRFSFGEITREDVRPAVRLDDVARPQFKHSESSAGLPGRRKTLRKSKSSETLRKSKNSELDPPRTASVHVARPQSDRLNTTSFHDERHRGHSSGAMLHVEAFEFEAPPQSAAMRHGISTPTLAPAALRHRRPGSRPSALAGAQLPSLSWPAGAAPAAAMGPLLGKGALPPTDAQQMAAQPDARDELRSASRSTPKTSPRGLDGLEPDPTAPANALAPAPVAAAAAAVAVVAAAAGSAAAAAFAAAATSASPHHPRRQAPVPNMAVPFGSPSPVPSSSASPMPLTRMSARAADEPDRTESPSVSPSVSPSRRISTVEMDSLGSSPSAWKRAKIKTVRTRRRARDSAPMTSD
jgi:hypothetical protein